MLDATLQDDMLTDGSALVLPSARSSAAIAPAPAALAAARYGAGRSVNMPAIMLVVALHAALGFALLHMRQVYVQKKEAALAVVNLTPPPPPPSEEPPPPPSPPQVVAPPPIVRTPLPMTPTVMTTPEPVPVPVTAAPSPPAPVALPPAPPSTVNAADLMARMVSGKPPRYPIESRRKHEQGTVVLQLVLGLDGRVASIAIAQSSGIKRLDDAALDAVRGWRWEPMIRNGAPVQVKGLVEIPFVLKV